MGSRCTEEELEVLADGNLGMDQQCALAARKAKSYQGCTNKSMGSTSKEEIVPLSSEHL